jgi:hypothetical protein
MSDRSKLWAFDFFLGRKKIRSRELFFGKDIEAALELAQEWANREFKDERVEIKPSE